MNFGAVPRMGMGAPRQGSPGMFGGIGRSGPSSQGTSFEDLIRARSSRAGGAGMPTMRDRGMAPEGVLSGAGDSGGGGGLGRAKRDFETYQYGMGQGGGSLEQMRGRFDALGPSSGGAAPAPAAQQAPSAPAPLIGGKTGQSLRGMSGALSMMSDERSKERIRELEGIKQRYEALIDTPTEKPDGFESVGAHEFSYKPEFQDKPGAGPGRFAGPMTSELKGIPGVVEQGEGGMEQVNTPRLTMANASATGELAREVSDLRARLAALSDDPDATLDVAGGRRR